MTPSVHLVNAPLVGQHRRGQSPVVRQSAVANPVKGTSASMLRNAPLSGLAAIACLVAATPVPVPTPSIQIGTATRTTYAQAYGFDWEFDDGVEVSDSTNATGGWVQSQSVDLLDWYFIPVASSTIYQESQIDPDLVTLTMDATADTAGNHPHSDSSGTSTFDVDFTVPHRVRYVVSATATANVGYNLANARLRRTNDSTTIVAVDADFGGNDVVPPQSSWLQRGDYSVDAECEAMAWGDNNTSISASSNVEFELRIFEAADFTLDGTVDKADWHAFEAAWQAGATNTDIDGSGVIDAKDWLAFEAAWKSTT